MLKKGAVLNQVRQGASGDRHIVEPPEEVGIGYQTMYFRVKARERFYRTASHVFYF